MFGVRWWIVWPLMVAALSISSLPKYVALWPRAQEVGAEFEWWLTVAVSCFNSVAASAGCIVMGWIVAWVWGIR